MSDIEDIYELSPMQQGILFHSLYSQSEGMYFHQLAWTFEGALNVDAFEQAWHRVVARHPVLRSSFHASELEKPLQVVRSTVELPWEELSWEGATELEERRSLFLQEDRSQGFELDEAPLMRCTLIHLGPERYEFIWSLHHLLLDGWSMAIVLKEAFEFYEAIARGKDLYLPPPLPFRDYILWLQEQDLSKAEAFWQQTLQGFKVPTVMPYIQRPTSDRADYQEQHFNLPEDTTKALQSSSQANGLTLNTLLQSAWALVLSSYSGESDVVFGVTVSGRPPSLARIESMVGVSIATLPARVTLPELSETAPGELWSWLRELQALQVEGQQYSFMPLVDIQSLSEVPQGMPLFESILIFQNYPTGATGNNLGDLRVSQIKGTGHSNYPLTVMASPGTELSVRLKYDRSRFDQKTIASLAADLRSLLEAIAANQTTNIAEAMASLPKLSKPLKLQQLEVALMSDPEVKDCYLLERENLVVAYVVLSSQLTEPEKLNHRLQARLSIYQQPDRYVKISALPLTDRGEIDEEALSRIPVLDEELQRSIEKQLQELPEIDRVAAVVRGKTKTLPPLHLSDLLPQASPPAVGEDRLATVLETPVAKRSPAISHGGPLQYPQELPRTLPEILTVAARESSNKILYIQRDGTELWRSYGDLLERARRINGGLKALGLQPQDKVILQIKNPQDFIPAFWGCILGGFVPVPLSVAPTYSQVNNAVRKLQNAWEMLEKPVVLASEALVEAIASVSAGFRVESCDRLAEYDPEPSYDLTQPEDLAILLLTSGSTGMPKAVMLSHRNILSSVAATSQVSQFTREDISLNWLPLDHPGPLIRCCIRCIFLRCQQIHGPTDLVLQEPTVWFDWLERYGVTTSWSPNFAFALVNDRAAEIKQRSWNLSAVRSLLNTAEPIAPQTAQRFWELFSGYGLAARAMHSSWGMAETSSGVTFSDRFLEANQTESSFAELGLPIPGVSLRIVNSENEVIESGAIGFLQVKGEPVTRGYYQGEELQGEVFTTDGWFATGDLGFLQDGRLTITGREKDVIIINGVNYYSHEIEAAIEQLPEIEVSYSAAVSVEGNKLALFFSTPCQQDRLRQKLAEIQQQAVSQIGIKPDYLLPVEKKVIPKTSIGKIQRSQLAGAFAAGEFKDILKEVDILLENANALPDWFYRQVWIAKQVRKLSQLSAGQTLIFMDSLGLGDYIDRGLLEENQESIKVFIAEEFTKLSGDRYTIDPKNAEHYQQLLESLATEGKNIHRLLHLWNYTEDRGEISTLAELENAQYLGAYSLLFSVRALVRVQGDRSPVQLLCISNQSQSVASTDKIAYEKSSVLGLLKTIPQEIPAWNCRHVDLVMESVEVNGDRILAEMQEFAGEPEVAYRQGRRLVPRLERRLWSGEKCQPLPFRQGGSYLITGGLGGIGVEIAKYLLENYGARLLLVGRKELQGEKLEAIEGLKQFGGSVVYGKADISDRASMSAIVSDWGELDGIIHLAGISSHSLLVEETQSGFAAALGAKVYGTWVLHELIKDKPGSLFINFSSVNGFFGGTTVGAYAAANSFLDAFSDYQRNQSQLHSYCFAWSMWNETGMSRGSAMKELSQGRGYYPIEKQQGINSFLAGMSRGLCRLAVGLDSSKANIQRYLAECEGLEKLTVYFTGTIPGKSAPAASDRFGTPISWELKHIPEMPLTDSGEIDRLELAGKMASAKTGEGSTPRNEVEREIAQIWQEVLEIENVGIDENFFQLGGHSLRALQVMYRLQNFFEIELPLQSLFNSPTIAGLAAEIARGRSVGDDRCLVPIQQKGERSPFFWVHPVGGNVLCYASLARHLGEEQPFYGLQSVGLDGEEEPLTSIEEMATRYIKAVRTVRPSGPYYLGGWSLGGAIAFEMAQQLSASGEEIGLLALADSYTPQAIARVSDRRKSLLSETLNVDLDDATLASYYFAQDLGALLGKELPISLERLQQLDRDAHLTYILEEAKIARVLPEELGLTQMRRLFDVFQANILARLRYCPEPYSGRIVLFPASETVEDEGVDLSESWAALAVGGLEVRSIQGDHYQCIESPLLAEQLRNYLGY